MSKVHELELLLAHIHQEHYHVEKKWGLCIEKWGGCSKHIKL